MFSFGHSIISNSLLNFENFSIVSNEYSQSHLKMKKRVLKNFRKQMNNLEKEMLSYKTNDNDSFQDFVKKYDIEQIMLDSLSLTHLFQKNKNDKGYGTYYEKLNLHDLEKLKELLVILLTKVRLNKNDKFRNYYSFGNEGYISIKDLITELSYILFGTKYNNLEMFREKKVVLEITRAYLSFFVYRQGTYEHLIARNILIGISYDEQKILKLTLTHKHNGDYLEVQ